MATNMIWRGPWLPGLLAAVLGAAAIPASAQAAFDKKIVQDFSDEQIGSISFPDAAGSTPGGVLFAFDMFGQYEFTDADITSIDWALDTSGRIVTLNLTASQGDAVCGSTADGPCSKLTLNLSPSGYSGRTINCGPPSIPGEAVSLCIFGIFATVPIRFVDIVPAYSCECFKGPLVKGPVAIKRKLLAWLRATLRDEDGKRLRRKDLAAAPLLEVTFEDTAQAAAARHRWPGIGADGTAFVPIGNQWHLLLTLKDFADPGSYTVKMLSGDPSAYRIAPTCEGVFVR